MYEQQLKNVNVDDLKNRMQRRDKAYLILDAREIDAFCKGHIPGAMDMFDAEITSMANKLDKNADIVVYGPGQWVKSQNPADRLSGDAAMRLMKMGFKNVMELNGGFEAWANAGNRVDTCSPQSIKPADVPLMSRTESGVRDV